MVDVFFSKNDVSLSDGLKKVFMVLDLVQIAEFVKDRSVEGYLVFIKEFLQRGLSFLLYLAGLATEDGVYLSLGLCSGDEIDPCRLYVLRLG